MVFCAFFILNFLLLINHSVINFVPVQNSGNQKINFSTFSLDKNLALGINSKKNSTFKAPVSLAVDKNGNIYILDREISRIPIYSQSGEFIKVIGNRKNGKELYSKALDLSFNEKDDLFLLDYNKKIKKAYLKIASKEGDILKSFELPFFPNQLRISKENIFISDRSYSKDHLVYMFSGDGQAVRGIGDIYRSDDVEVFLFLNTVTISSDQIGNLYLAYKFLPKVKIYSPDGKLLREFEYQPQIKRKRSPFESLVIQKVDHFQELVYAYPELKVAKREYPVCLDIAVDNSGMIYLLVASDHSIEERCALYCFDQAGRFIESVDLPVRCSRMSINGRGDFFFISQSATKSVLRYSIINQKEKNRVVSSKEKTIEEIEKERSSQSLLNQILDQSAKYFKKLDSAALNYFCEESIVEQRFIYPSAKQFPDLEKSFEARLAQENKYLYDYQLIHENDNIKERRILLEENGKKKNGLDAELKTQAFHYKKLIYGARVLNEYWQAFHEYSILEDETKKSEDAIVIDIRPKPPLEPESFWGKVWVQKKDYSILKIERNQKSIKGYEKIEEMALKYAGEPLVKVVCEYHIEKNGVRFPSHLTIEEAYLDNNNRKFVTSRLNVTYQNYKFFTVETEHKIIK
ncbi:MAG: hypothetical protein NTU60_05555 [Candidatus Aminicenantes bacterium]|nr:hypothetical protein [Candidatus Aminicenantes bacterium]